MAFGTSTQHSTMQLARRASAKFKPFSGVRSAQSTSHVAASSGLVAAITDDIRNKRRSATEIMQNYLDNLNEREGTVGSYISINAEQAMQQAKELDERIAKEGVDHLGPLAGVPVAIKDNICTRGVRTTAGSRILENYIPPFDATASSKLHTAGAIVIGKTNMDEFGMGSTTENSGFKVTRNPRDPARVPGGSSGGSAAAVAAQQCAVALGTDTGGSIRQPANFCGIVGLKPSYGRVSRYGLVSYASSLDCIGPMATTVSDAAAVLQAISGACAHDATSVAAAVPDYMSHIIPTASMSDKPLAGKKFAIISDTVGEGCDSRVEAGIRQAAKHMESLGAVVEEVSLPSFKHGLPAYYVLAVSEASSNLARYDGVRYGHRDMDAKELNSMYARSRQAGLGAEVKRRILMGTYALSAGYYDAVYKRAQQVRTLIRSELSSALSQYDGLLCPAAPTPAYKLGEKVSDPLAMYLGDLATVNINLAGLPALVLPVSYTQSEDGTSLPIGLQLVGKFLGEAELLSTGHILETTLGLQAPQLPSLKA